MVFVVAGAACWPATSPRRPLAAPFAPPRAPPQVDAALDLNHTQNIGRMIKQHFPQSQVRSLPAHPLPERAAVTAGRATRVWLGGWHARHMPLEPSPCMPPASTPALPTPPSPPPHPSNPPQPCPPAHAPRQFVVVSLKEGMFNNANVIYRTKFVDGVSTVSVRCGVGGAGAAQGQCARAGAAGQCRCRCWWDGALHGQRRWLLVA